MLERKHMLEHAVCIEAREWVDKPLIEVKRVKGPTQKQCSNASESTVQK